MKRRNLFLALICLAGFVGLGVLFFNNWVVQRPFGIVLILTDNLTPSHLAASRLYSGGASARLHLDGAPHLALARNSGADYAVPDVSAASTAIATGKKTDHRALAVDGRGEPLPTLVEMARKAGRSIGFVTNGEVTDAGLAAFYAHAPAPNTPENLAIQLVDSARPDLVLGGGAHRFYPQTKGGTRADNRDLLLELRDRGDRILRSRAELETAFPIATGNMTGLFADRELAASADARGTGHPVLSELVARAIQFLQFNQKGYLLVVDAGLVTRAAYANDGEATMNELLEVDRAARIAQQYAGESALVIVAGRTEIGGMTLLGYPLKQDHGVALTGRNAAGHPSITWASGPGKETEPSAVAAPAGISTASDVLVFAWGRGAEPVRGILENTDLFGLLSRQL
jgi:alkaline phosphatase